MISATGQVPNRLTLNKTMLPENYQKRSFFRFDTPVDLQRLTEFSLMSAIERIADTENPAEAGSLLILFSKSRA